MKLKQLGPTALAFTAILLTIVLAGCSKPQAATPHQQSQTTTASSLPSSTPGTDTPAETTHYIDLASQTYKATSLDDLREHAPFPLNVPGYLPAGYTLTWGMVNPAFESNPANVVMNFAAAGKPEIIVIESRGEIGYASHPAATSMTASSVQLGIVTGQMQKWINVGGSVNIIITFKAKDLYHIVNATEVPEADVLKVAESLSN